MLDEHGPIGLVLAFVDKPLAKSKGTADMVRRAIAAGVPYELREPEAALPLRLPLGAVATPVVDVIDPDAVARPPEDVPVRDGLL